LVKPCLNPTHTAAEGRESSSSAWAHAYIWAKARNLDVDVKAVSAYTLPNHI
jgi:hypothetical protein